MLLLLDNFEQVIEAAVQIAELLTACPDLKISEQGLSALSGGYRDLPARQQTMRNTIAWSYDLLTPDVLNMRGEARKQ